MLKEMTTRSDEDHLLVLKQARFTARDYEVLSAAEKERADAMTDGPRPSFVTARASLRRCLGVILNENPSSLPLRQEGTGPVTLEGMGDTGPYFSVSHTGAAENSYVAVIVSKTTPVGIDIEQPDRSLDWMRLAERRYHFADLATLKVMDPRAARQRFFELWTLKEAILKIEHGRLMTYLADVVIDMSHERPVLAEPTPGGLSSLYLETQYLGDADLMVGLAAKEEVSISFNFDRPRANFS